MINTLTMTAFYLQLFTLTPTLRYLEPEIPYSINAELLLLGTAAQETHLGELVKKKSRALDLYQMTEATEKDIWKNYMPHHPELSKKVHILLHMGQNYYAAAMVRVHYWRHAEQISSFRTTFSYSPNEMAHVWKRYYNTELGKGTAAQFVVNYKRLVQEKGK